MASVQGVSGLHAARKFGIKAATTDADAVMGDADVNAVVITTRHDSHARFVLQLDNFRPLRGYGWPGFSKMNLWRQDKGQCECAAAFVRAIKAGGSAPIPFDKLIEVSRVAIELAESARG